MKTSLSVIFSVMLLSSGVGVSANDNQSLSSNDEVREIAAYATQQKSNGVPRLSVNDVLSLWEYTEESPETKKMGLKLLYYVANSEEEASSVWGYNVSLTTKKKPYKYKKTGQHAIAVNYEIAGSPYGEVMFSDSKDCQEFIRRVKKSENSPLFKYEGYKGGWYRVSISS